MSHVDTADANLTIVPSAISSYRQRPGNNVHILQRIMFLLLRLTILTIKREMFYILMYCIGDAESSKDQWLFISSTAKQNLEKAFQSFHPIGRWNRWNMAGTQGTRLFQPVPSLGTPL